MIEKQTVLNIAVMTTDTPHHRYFLQRFVNELPENANVTLTLMETKPYPWKKNAKRWFFSHFPNIWKGLVLNPYLFPGFFSGGQAKFENQSFFPDGNSALPNSLNVEYLGSVNSPEAISMLKDVAPDIAVVYGTGKIKSEVFTIPRFGTINAHGGKLPGYRGLDTNLWAVHQGHPEDIYVSIHEIDENLDTGAVYLERQVTVGPSMDLYSLRYFTALVCTDLFLEFIKQVLNNGIQFLPRRESKSHYFGPMPLLLKLRTHLILRKLAKKISL
jgi:hypothetical protein